MATIPSLPPTIIQGSMSGLDVTNPAATMNDDGTDMATRALLEEAARTEGFSNAPQPANPIQQFLTLLGANAGAHLLRQPGAAQPGIRMVEQEREKEETGRIEKAQQFKEARGLRLQSMMRQADTLAQKAEREGRLEDALKLQKEAHKWAVEMEGLKAGHDAQSDARRHAATLKEISARGAQDRATALAKPGGAEKWPELMKREWDLKAARINDIDMAMRAAAAKPDPLTGEVTPYDPTLVDGLVKDLRDDFADREAAMAGQAGFNSVRTGGTTTGGAAPAKASDNPNLPASVRAALKAKGL